MIIKKYLVLVLVALSLTACATIKNPITTTTLNNVEDAYGAAIAIAVTYKRSCIARLINKSCFNIVAKIQPYEDKAYKALSIAQDFVKNNPTLDATTVLLVANDAIKAFGNEQFINGVK